MSSNIYYDLDEVTLGDIRRARTMAGDAAEFIARGTPWPDEMGGPLPTPVPNSRNFDYHEELMGWVDRLWPALDQGEFRTTFQGRDGASLLEIARYHFFFEYAAIEQRWRALCEVRRSNPEGRITWVAPAESHRDLAWLAAADPASRLELSAGSRSEPAHRRLWRRAKRLGRRAVDGILDRSLRLQRELSLAPLDADSRVVFVEYYPNSTPVLVPVAAELRSRQGIEAVWLAARESVRGLLQGIGIQSRLLRELAPVACSTQNHFSREARAAVGRALASLPDELYCGTGGRPGRDYLLPTLHRQLSDSLNQAAYWLDALSEAFGRLRPQCVVSTTYSSIVGRAAAVAGRARGAPSVYVQHGLFPDWRYFANFCNDRLLLWGQCNRRTMVRSGVADERIRVVGAPIYDTLRRPAADAEERLIGAERPLRVALMASRTGGMAVSAGTARRLLTTVAQAVAELPGAQLKVKVHPGDHTGLVQRTLAACPNCEIINGGSSQQVIRDSDAVLVVSSTTGLEACVLGKPLIVLRFPGISDAVAYETYGAAEIVGGDGADAATRLAESIRTLVNNPVKRAELAAGRQRLVDDMLNGLAPNAAELIAQSIAELIPQREAAESQSWSAARAER